MPSQELHAALKSTFGYAFFRPLQREIIEDALAGRDVFALLPTGGGKSLCFQLPALLRPGLTVVVSPLIALMKDQVDALTASGIAATFLNSTLSAEAARARLAGLHRGQYRLLYAAPERLMLPGFLENLAAWNVTQIAVDEAHCISEWGHDFRPEYRKITDLRARFPAVPIMALTATATTRVRADIVEHLGLRDPRLYVASFNRPNLTYRVVPKAQPTGQLIDFLRSRPGESGIVYCQSRKAVEGLAERINEAGIRARPYHAGLTPAERGENQELFLRDQVRVICATIAFGMGINKPNVRFVVHHDLPKNLEGYYQETGRAGRDGLPSECVLLFNAADVVKQTGFIKEKTDQTEQRIAREQLQQMVHFADSAQCRRAELMRYFGEDWPEENCASCDNCLTPRTTFDGTLATQKMLSCVVRIRQKSGFGFGLNHLIEVLTGAETENVKKWRHQEISVYGVGRELKRSAWQAIGRELIRLGFLRQSTEKFSTIELTAEGAAVLRERRKVTLTQPSEIGDKSARTHRGEIACDEALFDRLRALRRKFADERDVPAYIIFSDVALREMARVYPQSEAEFSRIPGVGAQKLKDFSAAFSIEIRDYLLTHDRQVFPSAPVAGNASRPRREDLPASIRETVERFRRGASVAEIAEERGFVTGTIFGHLGLALEAGEPLDTRSLWSAQDREIIAATFEKHGNANLTAIFEALGKRYEFGLLRLFRSSQIRENSQLGSTSR